MKKDIMTLEIIANKRYKYFAGETIKNFIKFNYSEKSKNQIETLIKQCIDNAIDNYKNSDNDRDKLIKISCIVNSYQIEIITQDFGTLNEKISYKKKLPIDFRYADEYHVKYIENEGTIVYLKKYNHI